jgi:hypothetical protein
VSDKYTDCPECGHHRSIHRTREAADRLHRLERCTWAGATNSLGVPVPGTRCDCTKTQDDIDDYIATFDDRTCIYCGFGRVTNSVTAGYSHGFDRDGCIRVMGQRIRELEQALFSRRAAIQDQKERKLHGQTSGD